MSTAHITQGVTRVAPSGLRARIARHPLVAYFTLAFALMWLFALPLALSNNQGVGLLPYNLSEAMGGALFLLATFSGPTVAALIVTGVTDGRAGVVRLITRCVQWRVRPQWYLVVLSLNMIIWLLAFATIMGPQLLQAAVIHWPLLFSTFVPLVAFGILIPSIAEEPGWRGFALPRLQQRYGPIPASLMLGSLHALWHLPALMTINFGPLPLTNLLPFLLTAVFATFMYTWVYNHTGGSILLSILLHASSNATSQWIQVLFNEAGIPEPTGGMQGFLYSTNWINVIAYALFALLLVIGTRGRLGYRPTQPQEERGGSSTGGIW